LPTMLAAALVSRTTPPADGAACWIVTTGGGSWRAGVKRGYDRATLSETIRLGVLLAANPTTIGKRWRISRLYSRWKILKRYFWRG